MATYLALQAISLSSEGCYIQPGELFTTNITPGLAWDPQDDEAKAAVAARDAAKDAKEAAGDGQAVPSKGQKGKAAKAGPATGGAGDGGDGSGDGSGGGANSNPPA